MSPNREAFSRSSLVELFFEPYFHFFEFSTSWSFYAPDPGTFLLYLDWEILGGNGELLETSRFPESPSPFLLRDRENRRTAAVRFMLDFDARTEKMMTPYLCNKLSGAVSVRLWRVIIPLPDWRDVANGKRRVDDKVGIERQWISHSSCKGTAS